MTLNREDHHSSDGRVEALHALSGELTPEAEAIVLEALKDPASHVRIAALGVLGDSFYPGYHLLLVQALRDDSKEVRAFASKRLQAYRRCGHGEFRIAARPPVQDCLTRLSSRQDHVREAALVALAGVTAPEILEPVLAVLRHDDSLWCRLAALEVLRSFDGPEVTDEIFAVLGVDMLGGDAARVLAGRRDPLTADRLLDALRSEDPAVRMAAAVGVGEGCDPRALLPLADMVAERNGDLGVIALESLKRLCDKRPEYANAARDALVPTLLKVSHAEGEQPRVAALELLAKLAPTQAVPALLQTLEWYGQRLLSNGCELFYWHHVLALVLSFDAPELIDALRRLSDLGDSTTRIITAEALVKFGDAGYAAVLLAGLADEDWEVRVRAVLALLAVDHIQARDAMVQLLKEDVDDRCFLKLALLQSLARHHPDEAFRLFLDILWHEDGYSLLDVDIGWIIAWLGNYGDSRALEPIRRFQHRELVNCDVDVVDLAMQKLACRS